MALALAMLLGLAAGPGTAWAQQAAAAPAGWRSLSGAGLRLDYAPQDEALAQRLWPVMGADREAVMERLRMFPTAELRIVLAPTRERFAALLGGAPAEGTLGVYLLGRRTIVLRSPRSAPGGDWDLRGVLRHEMAHAVIDMAIAQPVPLWLHEGLAILVSDELSYLDEAELTTAAVLGRLLPLPTLMSSFPRGHGARTVAYTEAASFVRFLLREQGLGGLQRLLERLATGIPPAEAFLLTYGATLGELEARWQGELAGRFSVFTLITTTTLLGGLGLPLLLLALARRWVQRRRAYARWAAEERLRATVRGVLPPRLMRAPGSPGAGPNGSGAAPAAGPPPEPPGG